MVGTALWMIEVGLLIFLVVRLAPLAALGLVTLYAAAAALRDRLQNGAEPHA